MEPINYLPGGAPANPLAMVLQGYAVGDQIRQQQQQQAKAQLAMQTAQQKMLREQQLQDELAKAADDPLQAGSRIRSLMTRYPEMAEKLERPLKAMTEYQQRDALEHSTQMIAALRGGYGAAAKQSLLMRAEAYSNQGDKQKAYAARMMADKVDSDPQSVLRYFTMIAAGLPDGDKVVDGLGKMGKEEREQALHPSALKTSEANAREAGEKATTAAVTAKYAEQNALKDLETKGWNIKSIKNDMAYKNASLQIQRDQIAAEKENNDLRRQELTGKVEDAKLAREKLVREIAAEGDAQMSIVAQAQQLIKEIRADPLALQMATGPNAMLGSVPGLDARTVAKKIQQLIDVLAFSNIDKIKGALSNQDIAFLRSIGTAMDRWQRTGKVVDELIKIDGVLSRTENRIRAKYGMPANADNPVDKPADKPVAKPPLTSWEKK